ncbi:MULTISPECIES: branched-chain-amino-acid transaminase [Salimicrobium]|uniref:Branched-chain-amino-acid aminotransferase n=3 Tax=Salimicrobium TaxID=351195 RepID=K2G9K4_9BACI|nr:MULTISPECIES: branched-chain-amino-acid transaminase [Salimicrobium]AKG04753.1 branched-chain-amino-acid transaminase [Salimicrobium jeotgali]EKE31743.1 branched-chain amino acid aminotransferase [Salimicrobium jeotgali]MBM7696297.1 branched-chain amino acid aminotransferase [Salimicrobium jeotgali]SDX37404.1 branched-chain amino acid aminotransferase [Salimicrobium album]SIS47216.1 branched-chain amino acid aminotransferase [Salimicrobium salexigens]
MSSQWIFLSGEFVTKQEASISVYDHGFLYGDGVFEGIRAYEGNIFKLDEHLNRLYDSAKSVMLEIPYSKEELEEIIAETIRKNELESAYIRVVVSRGIGDLGLNPVSCSKPRLVVIAEALSLFSKELYERGVRLASVASRRNRPDVLPPQVKSLNYLNNILVKMEANQAGVDEALMLNDQGYVTEGSADNVFIVKNGKIYTPPVYLGALEGITRNAIIDIADELGYQIMEQPFTRHDVYVADEVFLTGTAAEVIAAVEVDRRIIGDGKPGTITNHLLSEFRKVTTKDGHKVYPSGEKVQAG